MATIKTVLRPYKNNEGKQQITIRVSHQGKTCFHPTGEYILAKYFSTKEGKAKSTLSGWIQINTRLDNLVNTYKQKLNELLVSGQVFTAEDITIATDTAIASDEFYQYAYAYAEKFKNNLRDTSTKRVKTVIKKLKAFKPILHFSDIDSSFLVEYETYLKGLGNSVNTVNANMKIVRTLMRQAVKNGLVEHGKNPFNHYTFKTVTPQKEKLSEPQIGALKDLGLKKGSWLWHTRNYFLASYYMAGMRFADVCMLTTKNIQDNRIRYVMSKTGRRVSLPISDGLKAILEEYDAFNKIPGDYLLPLLHRGSEYSTPAKLSGGIGSKNTIVNKNLKILANMIGFEGKLTFHIARHSFADVSRKKGVNVYDISKLLGHSSISITEQYLRSIDPETFDEALALVYD